MDIAPVHPVTDHPSPLERVAAQQQAAAEKAKQQAQEAARKVPFDPAPALRPTIQDRIDIAHALLKMRQPG